MVYEIIMYMFACDRKIRKWAIKSLFIVEKWECLVHICTYGTNGTCALNEHHLVN